jgi:hypothetical protein
MSGEIIYIVSEARSGSTLLDQLLGAHPDITTVGEIHHLVAYATQDRSRHDPVYALQCTCGEELPRCQFWSQVETSIGRPLGSLKLKPRFLDKRKRYKLRPYLRRTLEQALQARPPGPVDHMIQTIFDVPTVARDSYAVFDAIFAVTNSQYIVDASKNTDRFRILAAAHPERLRLVLLSRDYRGVVFSKMKRGRSLEAAGRSWVRTMGRMNLLSQSMPDDRIHRLRYEDLCLDPKAELQKLCEFLSLPFSAEMLVRPDTDMHHIGGSPSKFQHGRREIKQDKEYDDAFTAAELRSLKEIIGDAGKEWGYD